MEYDSHVQLIEERTITRWIIYQEIILQEIVIPCLFLGLVTKLYAKLVVQPVMAQKSVSEHELPDPILQKMVIYQRSDRPIIVQSQTPGTLSVFRRLITRLFV